MRVCLGGTFSYIHKGHRELIKKAFDKAGLQGFVFIGLTSDEMIKNKKYLDYNKRENKLKNFLKKHYPRYKYQVEKINDEYGPAIHADFDCIVVSPETLKNAEKINEIRSKNNLSKIEIIQISYILADDGKPISSTRIHQKQIDKEGKIQ